MKKLFIMCVLLTLTGCSTFMSWQEDYPDNFAEEAVESFIKDETGLDIDFTPISGYERQTLTAFGE